MPPGRVRAAALVACALGGAAADVVVQQPRLPQLLALRGGVQPAPVVDSPATAPPANARRAALLNKSSNKPKIKRRKATYAKARPFGLLDVATAAVSLSALGAGHLASDPFMAAVPRGVKDMAWMIYGSMIASILFLIVRVLNFGRANAVNRAIAKLLFGPGAVPSRGHPVSSLPSLALISVVGALASFQTLPSSAG